ncbi:MAG: hypothetical protein ACOC5M_01275 [Chloroflexota bacterium]
MRGTARPKRYGSHATITCRTLPVPFMLLYSMAAAGLTWAVAAWREHRANRAVRERERDRRERGE